MNTLVVMISLVVAGFIAGCFLGNKILTGIKSLISKNSNKNG